jgi:hypothetical protein
MRRGIRRISNLFGWLVADGWRWFVLREEYCWLVAGGWFAVREKYCWLVADKPSEQGASTDVVRVRLQLHPTPGHRRRRWQAKINCVAAGKVAGGPRHLRGRVPSGSQATGSVKAREREACAD